MELFTYRGITGQTDTSVIPREHAEAIADAFERAGVESPYREDMSVPHDANFKRPPLYLRHPAVAAAVAELPTRWTCDVAYVLSERRTRRHFEKIRQDQTNVAHAGIRAYLLGLPEVSHLRTPEMCDRTDLAKLAMRSDFGNGKPIYTPEPGCKARLKLKQAVRFWAEQAAYADYTRYAIPVDIEEGVDMTACQRNLRRFCAALRTHNGFAGSGCTWEAELITGGEGSFVVMECRASISD